MEHFSAYDLQRHVGRVQSAAAEAPVAITHHGKACFVLMDYAQWRERGRGDALADAIKRLQANRALIREEGIAGVSIFGSVARGEARAGSDIDLLVEPVAGNRIGGLQLVRWKELLSRILGRKADIVVHEFLADKVRATLERDLVDAVILKHEDGGDAA